MKLNLLTLITIAITLNLTITLQQTTPLLESITQPTTSHLAAIQQSHAETKSKEYNFLYKPKVDPRTYLANHSPSPRIMKYLPLLNKQGELSPYNNNTDLIKQKYLGKLKYDKVADPNKVSQLTSFLGTEMGRSVLTYFQDLARGGLNYYKLTDPHFRQWLAIKIVAGKDVKMYARSIAEDIELFKQFYINARNQKIQEIRGVAQPPKQPMRYVPPPTKVKIPETPLNNKKVVIKSNQKKPQVVGNNTKPIKEAKIKAFGNMKPQIPANKQNNRQNTLKTQQSNVNVNAKTKQVAPSVNRAQNNTPKANKIAPIINRNKPIAAKPTVIAARPTKVAKPSLFNKQTHKELKVNNKQNSLPAKSNTKIIKHTQNSNNQKTAAKQAPNQLVNKNVIKNPVNTISRAELNRPKATIKSTQPKLTPELQNRQSLYAIEAKKPTAPKPYQRTEPIKPARQRHQSNQFTTNHVIQIVPESKIQVEDLFYPIKSNQK